MVRRPVTGTLNDVISSCPLCIGAGKRYLKMPTGAIICSDCKGFGRRIPRRVNSNQKQLKNNSNGQIQSQNDSDPNDVGGSRTADGVFLEPPSITSCSRCLSQGYTFQPGLR